MTISPSSAQHLMPGPIFLALSSTMHPAMSSAFQKSDELLAAHLVLPRIRTAPFQGEPNNAAQKALACFDFRHRFKITCHVGNNSWPQNARVDTYEQNGYIPPVRRKVATFIRCEGRKEIHTKVVRSSKKRP